jgi:hypothetical protein
MKLLDHLHKLRVLRPGQECVYQSLLRRDLARLGITDDFYPVGGAANHGLLYAILRIASECRPRAVLEFGAGQSSILLHRLRHAGVLNGSIRTVEHDPEWAARISRQVDHPVIHAGLCQQTVANKPVIGYDWRNLDTTTPIDLLLIDGPPAWDGRRRFSRLSCLRALDQLDPEGFVIIVDDAERSGERFVAAQIDHALCRRGITFSRCEISACNLQMIFAAGRHVAAAFI